MHTNLDNFLVQVVKDSVEVDGVGTDKHASTKTAQEVRFVFFAFDSTRRSNDLRLQYQSQRFVRQLLHLQRACVDADLRRSQRRCGKTAIAGCISESDRCRNRLSQCLPRWRNGSLRDATTAGRIVDRIRDSSAYSGPRI